MWLDHVGDVEVSQITTQDLRAYLAWLRTDYKPHRLSGEDHPLAPKTIRNVWVALSSFFAWASTEFGWPDPIQDVPPPRFEVAPVETFTKDEVEAILKACGVHAKVVRENGLLVRLGPVHTPTTGGSTWNTPLK